MDSVCHNIHRWESGQGSLTERYKLHYCKAFGVPPGQFGTAQAQPTTAGSATSALAVSPSSPAAWSPASATPGLADPRLLVPVAVAYRGIKESDMGDSMVEREVRAGSATGSTGCWTVGCGRASRPICTACSAA